jgi:hypothetical protein
VAEEIRAGLFVEGLFWPFYAVVFVSRKKGRGLFGVIKTKQAATVLILWAGALNLAENPYLKTAVFAVLSGEDADEPISLRQTIADHFFVSHPGVDTVDVDKAVHARFIYVFQNTFEGERDGAILVRIADKYTDFRGWGWFRFGDWDRDH